MSWAKYDLWGSVPSGSNVLCHHFLLFLIILLSRSNQSKITKLCLTFLIYQNVRWLQIPMNKPSSMNIKQRLSNLIENIFAMPIRQYIFGSTNFIQISIHMFKQQINIFAIFSFYYLFQNYNIRMFELYQEHDLSVYSLCVSWVCKSIEVFLKSFNFMRVMSVLYSENMTVCSTSQLLNHFESSKKVRFNLFCHLIM